MKKSSVMALFSALITAPALADNTGRYYVAADLGAASYSNVTVAAGTYPDPGMFRIAGGYHINPLLAAEVAYSVFGDSTLSTGTSSGTVSASSFQIAAVGTLPLSPQFDLIVKLGLANNHHKIEAKSLGVTMASMSDSHSDLLTGFGAQYHFSPDVSLRVQYENFGEFGNFGTTGRPMRVSALSVGMAFNF